MTITIDFSPGTLQELKAEADATGKDVATVIREAVESRLARRRRTFAEVLKPIHDAVEASHMSELDVEQLVEEELRAVRATRPSAQAQP